MVTGRIKDGYGTIQRDIMTMKMSIFSKAVYCLLISYAGDNKSCFPSLKTICEDLDISKPTVIKAIKELISKGLLAADKRKTSLGEHESNIYYPLYIMDEKVVNDIDNPGKQVYNGSKPDLPPVVNGIDTKINNLKMNKEDHFVNDIFPGFGFKEKKKKEAVAVYFKDSPEFDIDYLIIKLQGSSYIVADANIYFYHECAAVWSENKNKKATNWTTTIKNFMLRDIKDKKLVTNSMDMKLRSVADMINNMDNI